MKMWPKLKIAINGFTSGTFLTLFFITLALGMNPWIFFVAFMCTSGLLVADLTNESI